jgi:hypothetical protein
MLEGKYNAVRGKAGCRLLGLHSRTRLTVPKQLLPETLGVACWPESLWVDAGWRSSFVFSSASLDFFQRLCGSEAQTNPCRDNEWEAACVLRPIYLAK